MLTLQRERERDDQEEAQGQQGLQRQETPARVAAHPGSCAHWGREGELQVSVVFV